MKITNILFETLPGLHTDGKEAIVFLPRLPSGSILVVESLHHLPKVLKRLSLERIEPVVGSVHETGWEYTSQENVVIRVNRHPVMVLAEMLDGVDCS